MIPTLTDYQTGEAIRPATRGEHLRKIPVRLVI